MKPDQCYRINQPAVIAKVIDGEAIFVNLDSGAHYSLRDSACTISGSSWRGRWRRPPW